MSKVFRLKIELGNDAMSTAGDIRRALAELTKPGSRINADALMNCDERKIMDVNGNSVGKWGFYDETPASADTAMKILVIVGRKWFQRGTGNTYCTAEVHINGEFAFKTEREDGYGDYYRQTAFDQLEQRGLLPAPRERYGNGGAETDWAYCQRNGITYSYLVSNVRRKSDL